MMQSVKKIFAGLYLFFLGCAIFLSQGGIITDTFEAIRHPNEATGLRIACVLALIFIAGMIALGGIKLILNPSSVGTKSRK